MNQRIFISVILIIIGVLVGLFILTSYQFHKRLNVLEDFVINNGKDISTIEDFINTNLIRQPEQPQAGEGN